MRRWASGGIAAIVMACVGAIGIATARAGDEPPVLLGEGVITVTVSHEADVYATAKIKLRIAIVGINASVECVPPSHRDGLCLQQDGLVHLRVSTTSTKAGTGTLVVSDPDSGRSASRPVVIPGKDVPTQPKQLTVPVLGCADWYNTHLFGCPDKKSKPIELTDVRPPEGTAVLSGTAGNGTLAVASDASASTISGPPESVTIVGLDGFGESSGTLGSGDESVTITIRRRAPIAFGLIVVLLGAALAAFVGWFTEWARKKSESDIAADAYKAQVSKLKAARDAVREKLRESGPANLASMWGLADDEFNPDALNDLQQQDSKRVTSYVEISNKQIALWQQLDQLLKAKLAVERLSPGCKLGQWVSDLIGKGPNDNDFEDGLALANSVRATVPITRPDPEPNWLSALLNSLTNDEVRAWLEEASRRPGVEEEGLLDAAAIEAAPPDLMLAGRENRRSDVSNTALFPSLGSLVLAAIVIVGFTVSWATAEAVSVYAAALAAIPLFVWQAKKKKKIPVLVAAAIGWALAAAFGGADALDATKAWGSMGDIAKTLGASFAVAGGAQILRFGFPKSTTSSA